MEPGTWNRERSELAPGALDARGRIDRAIFAPSFRVSWLVGRLSAGGKDYIFASNIVRRGTLDPVEASRQAFKVFRERRLID